jgi:C-terminal processing protease CtpA/Prc
MKCLTALATACLVCMPSLALTPAQSLEEQSAQAQSLFDKHAYADAAAAFEKIAADSSFSGLQPWPDALYGTARAEALAGHPDKALEALTKAVDLGGTPSADAVTKEAAFASLRETPRFKEQVARLEKEAALWKDDPAIATPYKPMLSEAEKVAGLSKLWSEARFNFPFFGRVPDLDWDAAYMATLPQVIGAKTTVDYYAVLIRFMATLKDGHTRIIAPPELHSHFYGVTAIETRLIEGKIVVIGVSDPALAAQGINIGAEVVAIDGKPALEYAKDDVAPNVYGFTPQDRDVWIYGYQLLRGPASKPVRLTLRDADGKTGTAVVPRHQNTGPFGILPEEDLTAHFKMLLSNIAYLKVNVFADDSGAQAMRKNFAAIKNAKGLIIDIRDNGGGNSDNGYALLSMLVNTPFHDSNWRTRDYKAAFRSWNVPIGWMRASAGTYQPDPKLYYAGPVVVLTSPRTYSAAEDFTVAFVAAKRGMLVGQTTGGSTGNPMLIKLPGGGLAFICTKDDSFPDGRVFEGVGIAPDIAVKPTIADIRAGRDPVLERAAEMLKMKF